MLFILFDFLHVCMSLIMMMTMKKKTMVLLMIVMSESFETFFLSKGHHPKEGREEGKQGRREGGIKDYLMSRTRSWSCLMLKWVFYGDNKTTVRIFKTGCTL